MPLTKKTRIGQADKGSLSLISKVKNAFSKDKVIGTTATVTTIDDFWGARGHRRNNNSYSNPYQAESKLMT